MWPPGKSSSRSMPHRAPPNRASRLNLPTSPPMNQSRCRYVRHRSRPGPGRHPGYRNAERDPRRQSRRPRRPGHTQIPRCMGRLVSAKQAGCDGRSRGRPEKIRRLRHFEHRGKGREAARGTWRGRDRKRLSERDEAIRACQTCSATHRSGPEGFNAGGQRRPASTCGLAGVDAR